MNDATARALILAVMLILPVSALVARRMPLSTTLKYALAWIAVFVLGYFLLSSFT